jgi:ubiquitin C-terminal hydrolase
LEESPENNEICGDFKDCFTGQTQFQTVCDNCKYVSAGQREDFNELQLPVLKQLDDAFKEYLKEEVLKDDNKYFCLRCNSKQDATRRMKILRLPPVLNLQLMRFIYD